MTDKFKALVVEESEKAGFIHSIQERNISDLPQNGVLIRVHYSSLNYKDALSASGNKGITRKYPHTPGIDVAGVVETSNSDNFKAGDKVICTGYDLGMNTPGGFAEYVNVPAEWVLPLPENLSMREAMVIGTAGFTAAIGVSEIAHHIQPEDGPVLVTGATGGVGIVAVKLLAKSGYHVAASTGKTEWHELLLRIGAKDVIGREDVNDQSDRAMLSTKWMGAFDTVGGNTLATVLKSIKYGGIVTNCGNVASPKLDITVFPFILRSVRLIGIAAAETPMAKRAEIWRKLSNEYRLEDMEYLVKEIALDAVSDELSLMLQGRQGGRVIVNLQALQQ